MINASASFAINYRLNKPHEQRDFPPAYPQNARPKSWRGNSMRFIACLWFLVLTTFGFECQRIILHNSPHWDQWQCAGSVLIKKVIPSPLFTATMYVSAVVYDGNKNAIIPKR